MKFSYIKEKILDFFYPRFCLFCQKEKTYLCPECFSKIKIYPSPFCPYCRSRSPDARICKRCKKALFGFVAAASYKDEVLRILIDHFKFNFIKELTGPLAFLIFKFLKENPEIEFFKNPLDFWLVPIPLHPRRLRWRGFNQAKEIAKVLSPLLKIPLKSDLLLRKKSTKPQAKIKGEIKEIEKLKKENVKGVFSLNEKYKNFLSSKKVILVDDVATSLATLEEAGKTLKEAEVEEIWGLVVAKG